MKTSPGRKQRREFARQHTKKRGDLCRRSTHEMRTKMGMKAAAKVTPKQKAVKAAVKDELKKKFSKPEVLQLPADVKSYFCSKCQHSHKVGTKVFSTHRKHARTPLELA